MPGEEGLRYIEIDLGSTGFAVVGDVTWMIDGWPNRTPVNATVQVSGTKAIVTASKDMGDAFAHYITIAVANPAQAGRVSLEGVVVRSGKNEAQASVKQSMTRHLDIGFKVTSSVPQGIVGATENVTFHIRDGKGLVREAVSYILKWNTRVMTRGFTDQGELTFPLPFVLEPGKASTSYTLEVARATEPGVTGVVSIPIRYAFTATGLTGARYLHESNIGGLVVDAAGTGVAGQTVSLVNKGAPFLPLATGRTDAEGQFAMEVTFQDAGLHSLQIGSTEYAEFMVEGVELDVVATPPKVANNSTAVSVEARVMRDVTDVSQAAEIRVLAPDGSVHLDWSAGQGGWFGGTGKRIVSLGKNLPLGEYLLEARWESTDGGETPDYPDAVGAAFFEVQGSSVVVNAQHIADGLMSVGPNSVTVKVVDSVGAGRKEKPQDTEIRSVQFEISGGIENPVSFDSSLATAVFDTPQNTSKTLDVVVMGAEEIRVKGTVTLGNGRVEPFEQVLKTNGWIVHTQSLLGHTGDVVTLRAVVRTAGGVPVNNAVVSWVSPRLSFATGLEWGRITDRVIIEGLKANVQDGIYEQEIMLFHPVEQLLLTVERGDGQLRGYRHVVIGDSNFFTLVSEPHSLIATANHQSLQISHSDPQGRVVLGNGGITVSGAGIDVALTTRTDRDVFQLQVSPAVPGLITIAPGFQDQSRFNTVVVPVLAPKLATGLGEQITENMYHNLSITSLDLLSNGHSRPFQFRFSAQNAHLRLETPSGNYAYTTGTTAEQTYTSHSVVQQAMRLMAWSAGSHEKEPRIILEASYNNTDWAVVAEWNIAPLKLLPSLDRLLVGTEYELELFVQDANGVPLAGRTVIAGSSHLSDSVGRVALLVRPTGTSLYPISVLTDREVAGVKLTQTIYLETVFDEEPPRLVVEAPPVSRTDTTAISLSFSDNVGVTALYANSDRLNIDLSLGSWVHGVNLKPGTNVFSFAVVDLSGNRTEKSVTIRFEPRVSITIPLGHAMPEIGLDVPPEIRNGRTMVPLRWFGEYVLGLPTESIEFKQIDGRDTVILRGQVELLLPLNSLVSQVDGFTVLLDVPAYISRGRTLVPARFLAETFGYVVSYDEGRNVVVIE